MQIILSGSGITGASFSPSSGKSGDAVREVALRFRQSTCRKEGAKSGQPFAEAASEVNDPILLNQAVSGPICRNERNKLHKKSLFCVRTSLDRSG